MSEAQGWSDYWKEDGATGEVFVGKDGSTNPHIKAFWHSHLADLEPASRIVDIACGAGSIFNHLADPNAHELFAADLSAEALTLLRQRIPQTLVVAASASALPFGERSFDIVVSQFGIEYAGHDAFAAAARLVRPGGQMVTLSHIEDGYIDAGNQKLLTGAELCRNLNFIPLAADLTTAAFTNRNFDSAARAFQPAERALAAFVGGNRGGIHEHLYLGFRQLFEHRAQYALQDITGWLDAMSEDLDRNILRLGSMRSAALSQSQVEQARSAMEAEGMVVTVKPFEFPEYDKPVAWQIEGVMQ